MIPNEIERVLIDEREIDEIIDRVAAQISRDYAGQDKHLLLYHKYVAKPRLQAHP